jgi:hypothetical protein
MGLIVMGLTVMGLTGRVPTGFAHGAAPMADRRPADG